jgi:adenosylcobinamide-GDP ribazoletransferase
VNGELRGALAAVAFLTRAPIPARFALVGEDVRRGAAYFPLVGAAVGAGAGRLADRAGPELGLLGATLLTGALHLDALADLADATGAHTRERALEIMKDPRLGAFGVTAITLDLLVKTAALTALTEQGRAVRGGAAAGALSRAVPVVLAAGLPAARAEGSGATLARCSGRRATAAAGLSLGCAVVAVRAEGVRLAAVAAVMTAVAGPLLRRWLGGVTGDAVGAALELTETATLVLAARR